MTDERRFQTAFRQADSALPGLIQKDDGTVWLVNPNGFETQLPGGASAPPIWTDITSTLDIDNGTVDMSNSYALALTQAADPSGAFPSLTSVWLRVIYDTYTGGGEAGILSMGLPNGSAAAGYSYRAFTGEISGLWGTGGLGGWSTFGAALWSSSDGNVNVEGSPVFASGEILIAGTGTFPSG